MSDILSGNMKEEQESVGFLGMYKYAGRLEKGLAVLGFIIAIVNGGSIPILGLLIGNSIDAFGSGSTLAAILPVFKLYLAIGASTFVLTILQNSCFSVASERISLELRKRYVESLFRQELGWFQCQRSAELSHRMAEQVNSVQRSTSQLTTTLVMMASSVGVCLLVSFVKGWELTLIGCVSIPVIVVAGYFFGKLINSAAEVNKEIYAEAGGKAEQVLSAIATVKCLSGEHHQEERYLEKAKVAKQKSIRAGWQAAVTIGLFIGIIPIFSALVFYVGSIFVRQNKFNQATGANHKAGDVITVFFSVLLSGLNLGQVFPILKNIQEGPKAAAQIYKVIEREPTIKDGAIDSEIQFKEGSITFNEVTFTYPTREEPVLKGLNLEVKLGKRNALVGESGSGKSTIAQLLLRLYDPSAGQILIQGINLSDYTRKSLLGAIGYVGQEPSLFSLNVRENVKFGTDASDEDIWEALRQAQAYQFVKSLPEELDTFVGPGGCKLSGGQKQRLAIARAIVRKPKLLILDEATSALDRLNEKLIQETLDKLSLKITTLIIAHKLKTIEKADCISLVAGGRIELSGTFKELYDGSEWFRECVEREKNSKDEKELQTFTKFSQQEEEKDKDDSLKVGSEVGFRERRAEMIMEAQEDQKIIGQENEDEGMGFMLRLARYSAEDWPITVVGFLAALANGTLLPIFGLYLARMLSSLILMQDFSQVNNLALNFFIIGLSIVVLNFLQFGLFNHLAEKVTYLLRQDVFRKLLAMPMTFFVKKENSPGALSEYLFSDMNNCSKLTSTFIGMNLQNLSSVVTGLAIALSNYWLLCLVTLFCLPLMVVAAVAQLKVIAYISHMIEEYYRESSGVLSQYIQSIKTVKAFGREQYVSSVYHSILQNSKDLTNKKVFFGGFFFGLSQFLFFLVFGIVFLSGAGFIDLKLFVPNDSKNDLLTKILACVFATIFCSTPLGYYGQFMPDISAGKTSALRIFKLLDLPLQQIEQEVNQFPQNFNSLQFKKVKFSHEGKVTPVLNGLSFTVNSGEKLALTGPSGSGKSTVVQLLLKLYRLGPRDSGEILINGVKIQSISRKSLRRKIGIVQQQPVLFNCSIRENIIYNQIVSEQFYEKVKKLAKIDFMDDDAQVGARGGLLSGGQKQRIAIARALVRKPALLVLDEATSALDHQSQQEVQEAMARLGKEVTTLAVAHRLSTIQDADNIIVMDEGMLLEQGTYDVLTAREGYFYRLQQGLRLHD